MRLVCEISKFDINMNKGYMYLRVGQSPCPIWTVLWQRPVWEILPSHSWDFGCCSFLPFTHAGLICGIQHWFDVSKPGPFPLQWLDMSWRGTIHLPSIVFLALLRWHEVNCIFQIHQILYPFTVLWWEVSFLHHFLSIVQFLKTKPGQISKSWYWIRQNNSFLQITVPS